MLLNFSNWHRAREACAHRPRVGRNVQKGRIHGDGKGISGCQGLGEGVTANEGSFQEQKGSAQELFNNSVGGQSTVCQL